MSGFVLLQSSIVAAQSVYSVFNVVDVTTASKVKFILLSKTNPNI